MPKKVVTGVGRIMSMVGGKTWQEQSRNIPRAEQEQGRCRADAGVGQNQELGRSKAEAGQELGSCWEGAGQEQSRTRAGVGTEQSRNRVDAGAREQGQGKSRAGVAQE